MLFGWSEEDVVESVVAAGREDKQVVAEISLSFAGLLDERETVFASLCYLVRDRLPAIGYQLLADSLDMGDDAVDVLPCAGAVVVGLEQDDMCAGMPSEIGTYLRLVGFFFEHGNGYEQAVRRFDRHRGGDEDVGTSFVATLLQMLSDGA